MDLQPSRYNTDLNYSRRSVMKPFGRLILLFAVLAVALAFSGPVAATESESTGSSSATAVVDFMDAPPYYISCAPSCPPRPGTSPFVPPIPVTTLAECEAYCRSACNVSTCNLTPPAITPG